MWIITYLIDRISSVRDLGKDMEWFSPFSPIMSVLIFTTVIILSVLIPLPSLPGHLLVGVILSVLGFFIGNHLQKKIDDPSEASIKDEWRYLLPFVQLQTVIIATWISWIIIAVRLFS